MGPSTCSTLKKTELWLSSNAARENCWRFLRIRLSAQEDVIISLAKTLGLVIFNYFPVAYLFWIIIFIAVVVLTVFCLALMARLAITDGNVDSSRLSAVIEAELNVYHIKDDISTRNDDETYVTKVVSL